VRGILLNADRRTLFVVLDNGRFPADIAAGLEERLAAMSRVADAVRTWRDSDGDSIELAVRVGFEPPAGVGLVAVDRASERLAARPTLMQRLRKPRLAGTIASLVGLSSAAPALASDLAAGGIGPAMASPSDPAVAAPNLAVLGAGGWLNGEGFDNRGFGAAGLEATTPLGDRFGAQFDAAFGSDQYYGVGGHLFWRDSLGLVGLLGSYESLSGQWLSRVAVEGEAYMNNVTLRGEVGGQTGNRRGAFGGLDLTFYATPNFALSVGGEVGSRSLARGSVEWQPAPSSVPGLSLFADGEVGSDKYASVLAGVRYYFGTGHASLKERDRRYDPGFSLFNMQNLVNAGYTPPHH
jgi:hypothetical protein